MHPPLRAGSEAATPFAQSAHVAQAAIFWAIWLSMTTGVVMFNILLRPNPARPDTGTAAPAGFGPVEWLCVGLIAVSAALRWLVLPRLPTLVAKLPVFIVACAITEASGILSLFLSSPYHRELFLVSLLVLLTLAPLFSLPRRSGFPRSES